MRVCRITRLVGAAGALVLLFVIGWAELRLWQTGDHDVRIGVLWSLATLIGIVAAIADVFRRRASGRRTTLALVIADALLSLVIVVSVLAVLFGALAGAVLGIGLGVPVAALLWFARRRMGQGRPDGAGLLCALLVLGALTASRRPWTPTSAQWLALEVVALAGALAVAASTARTHLRARTGAGWNSRRWRQTGGGCALVRRAIGHRLSPRSGWRSAQDLRCGLEPEVGARRAVIRRGDDPAVSR